MDRELDREDVETMTQREMSINDNQRLQREARQIRLIKKMLKSQDLLEVSRKCTRFAEELFDWMCQPGYFSEDLPRLVKMVTQDCGCQECDERGGCRKS